VTEFSQGITPNSGPLGITKGPDGNLWFAESNTGKIGRITPHGVVTEFQVALPGQGPWWITAGPDGNIWFTESNAIGRITTSGTDESVFAAGFDPGAAPWQITSGPDGNLWFTDSTDTAARIGRITPRGVVTEFTQGISSTPYGITALGSELWFTENERSADRIGRVEFCDPRLCEGELTSVGGEEQLTSTLRQPSNIGFLVQRLQDGKRLTVGRVPLGHHPEGRLALRWDLKVDGRKLVNGRYLITLRALDAHKHAIDKTLPVAITVS
jgi:hypothetical protein